jgi:hypothetical protein
MKARPSISRSAANDPQSYLDLPNMRQRLRSGNAERIIKYTLCTVSATSASEFEKEVTTWNSTLLHDRTVFDGWRSTNIGLYMAIVGQGVTVGIPVISTVWVTQPDFAQVEVGRVAGADLGGLAIGAY